MQGYTVTAYDSWTSRDAGRIAYRHTFATRGEAIDMREALPYPIVDVLACSREDDPTEHDAPRDAALCGSCDHPRHDGRACTFGQYDHCSIGPRMLDTDGPWSRDRDDHDAAVSHFIGRVSPWVARALAGTLPAKALA